jgi:hypothetical protein
LSRELNGLTSFQPLGNAFGSNFQAATVDANGCTVAIRIGVRAISAWGKNGEGAVGRVDLNGMVGLQLIHTEPDRPLLQTELHDLVS